jgi:hypothetical protein
MNVPVDSAWTVLILYFTNVALEKYFKTVYKFPGKEIYQY